MPALVNKKTRRQKRAWPDDFVPEPKEPKTKAERDFKRRHMKQFDHYAVPDDELKLYLALAQERAKYSHTAWHGSPEQKEYARLSILMNRIVAQYVRDDNPKDPAKPISGNDLRGHDHQFHKSDHE